jgi:hypothetical protein
VTSPSTDGVARLPSHIRVSWPAREPWCNSFLSNLGMGGWPQRMVHGLQRAPAVEGAPRPFHCISAPRQAWSDGAYRVNPA